MRVTQEMPDESVCLLHTVTPVYVLHMKDITPLYVHRWYWLR